MPAIRTLRITPAGAITDQTQWQPGDEVTDEARLRHLARVGMTQLGLGDRTSLWYQVDPAEKIVNLAATGVAARAGHHVVLYGPVVITAGEKGQPPHGLTGQQADSTRRAAETVIRAVATRQLSARSASLDVTLPAAFHALESAGM